MQFGNAIFLLGLLAVPLPIIIHLYFRRNRIRVKFSTTQFFRKREKVLAFKRKLRDILLLVLRTLSILLLVLALSMPLLSSFKYISGGRTDAVIILDDTLSMCRKCSSGQTAYDYARKKAQEITGTLGGGDSAALILLSGGKGISLTRNIQKVGDAIRNSSPSGATGSYSGALK
ncbi:MAG: BatA and WFA domain-containing protein [Lentisphaerota bacterium]